MRRRTFLQAVGSALAGLALNPGATMGAEATIVPITIDEPSPEMAAAIRDAMSAWAADLDARAMRHAYGIIGPAEDWPVPVAHRGYVRVRQPERWRP